MPAATEVKIKPINQKYAIITIASTTPMIQHRWSQKAIEQMKEKKLGRKTKNREVCDPEQEALDATYFTEAGECGIPVTAVKASMISAAHKDLGIEKTLVRKALFIECDDANKVIPIRILPIYDSNGKEIEQPLLREDTVRVGMGSADLRWRPEFRKWEADLSIEYNGDMLTLDDIGNLISLAGFGVGICEWRPEKGGENGRFEVKAKEEQQT